MRDVRKEKAAGGVTGVGFVVQAWHQITTFGGDTSAEKTGGKSVQEKDPTARGTLMVKGFEQRVARRQRAQQVKFVVVEAFEGLKRRGSCRAMRGKSPMVAAKRRTGTPSTSPHPCG